MRKLLLSTFVASSLFCAAQNNTDICATMQSLELQKQQDASLAKRMNDIEQFTQQWIKNNANSKILSGVVTVPVVFHIVSKNANEDVSSARIDEQIVALNRDFRKLNTDISNVPSAFAGLAADCKIEFCLAKRDPFGQNSTGITRTTTTEQSFSATTDKVKFTSMGGHDIWDHTQYLNIWVCDIESTVLGYGFFPGADPARDGVVIDYTTVGTSGTVAPYNLGRTATHEVAHWFNLHHIWGNASCGDDFVADTPQQQDKNSGCPNFPHVTCGNSPNGDMFMNYMDYSDHACLLMFTAGQRDRMLAALYGPRKELMSSPGCYPVNGTTPVANFISSKLTLNLGQTVNFTDLSSNNPTSWSWTFQGATPATSTDQNPANVKFNSLGCFEVTLTATNGNGSDTRIKTCYIEVTKNCTQLSNMKQNDSLVYAKSDNWGWLAGHNGYGVKGVAEKYTSIPASYKIDGVYVGTGRARHNNSIETVTVKIYEDDGTSQAGGGGTTSYTNTPNTVVGSQTVTYSELASNTYEAFPTYIKFATPVTVNGAFYAGVEYTYAAGDTLAFLHNKYVYPSVGKGTAWEKWSDGHWQPFSDKDWWKTDMSLAIFPVACDPATGIQEVFSNTIEALLHPNPNDGSFQITVATPHHVSGTVEIFNVVGERVYNAQINGGKTHTVAMNDQPIGVYFAIIKTNEGSTTKKFVITR